MGYNKRAVKCRSEDHIHMTVWRDKKPLKREMGENTEDGTPESWFKITVPRGMKYDKIWLLNSLQSHCSVPFTPVDFHYGKNHAQFFVQGSSIASALKDVSKKICDEDNQEWIPIFVQPSTVPYSVENKLEPEEMEQLKTPQSLLIPSSRLPEDLVGHDIDIILNRRNCMAATLQIIKENFPELLSLNLSNNRLYQLDGLSDIVQMVPTVKNLNLSKNEVSRRSQIRAGLQVGGGAQQRGDRRQEKLNLVWELGKVKGLKLEELWLEGNPLCYTFQNQAAYISITTRTINHIFLFLVLDSAIRDCFPKLLRLVSAYIPHVLFLTLMTSKPALRPASSLVSTPDCLFPLQDGQELPPPPIADIDRCCLKKPCEGNLKGSDVLKNLVLPFLQQYYVIYDSGDRQGLLGAYHVEACFSLTIPFSSEAPALSSLREYAKDSRNIKELKDPFLRVQLLKYTQREVLRSLCMLPRTHHDLSSFVVDIYCYTETMLCFTVNGVFKEGFLLFTVFTTVGWYQGSLRAFTRTFITIPARNTSLCITNDELFVREAIPKVIQSTFSTPVPISSWSFMPILSREQHEMVKTFSNQSGMKLQWSLKCLQDNRWNYARADQVFAMFKAEGKIPEEAFKPVPKQEPLMSSVSLSTSSSVTFLQPKATPVTGDGGLPVQEDSHITT
ncbi:hypothetical protein MC885_021278 [Smutsia gigantea]|nr:hypothetical protein MC885_021278 [Smutsia gigantea]